MGVIDLEAHTCGRYGETGTPPIQNVMFCLVESGGYSRHADSWTGGMSSPPRSLTFTA